jgi:hypothetical protein
MELGLGLREAKDHKLEAAGSARSPSGPAGRRPLPRIERMIEF